MNGAVRERQVGSVLRDRDMDGNGTLDERLWATADAAGNSNAFLNAGAVVERFGYEVYGATQVRNPDGSADADGSDFAWTRQWGGYRHNL